MKKTQDDGEAEAVRRSDIFMRATIESLPFDVFAIGADGRYVLQNATCKEHWGELIGKTPEQVAPDDETRSVWRRNNERAFSGEVVRGEVCFEIHGETHHIYNILCPVRDRRRTIGILGVNIDITARKKLEAELFHAQKMEAVGTLAGGIAHDFNNLLQGIGGFAELLLMDMTETSEFRGGLEQILTNARRGRDLTRQILIFSRKMPTQKRPLDLNQEIREIETLLRRTLPSTIRIEMNLAAAPLEVKADPIQLQQVLVNLVVNARDAMPEGGALVIRTKAGGEGPSLGGANDDLGGRVRLEVIDSGEGMEPETVQRVFDPFFTTKAPGLGTGLGLAVVYGIVEGHGGAITCRSTLGAGTTFTVDLPLYDGLREEASTVEESVMPGGSETILLVDDDEVVRSFCEAALERFGYTVLVARDGRQGVETFRAKADTIDLVVTDLIMPGLSGSKLVEAVRDLRPGVKIVVISGYHKEGPGLLPPGHEGQERLQKPFGARELLQVVRDVLDEG